LVTSTPIDNFSYINICALFIIFSNDTGSIICQKSGGLCSFGEETKAFYVYKINYFILNEIKIVNSLIREVAKLFFSFLSWFLITGIFFLSGRTIAYSRQKKTVFNKDSLFRMNV